MLKEKTVNVVEGLTGNVVSARLLLCERCEGNAFHLFLPEGVDHSHFQCVRCGACFCDGCTSDFHNVDTVNG